METEPREALIVGHPGHEVRVYGWLTMARPLTCVITDGSGATGSGRLAATEAVLRSAGATRGGLFGALADLAAYGAILSRNTTVFRDLADAIARELAANGITSVAGDGWEGYNPVHDVCRLVIDAAVRLASRREGRVIENWSFPLVGRPDSAPASAETRVFTLDDRAFEKKMEVAEQYRELVPDVAWAIREYGRDAFRTEVLTKVNRASWHDTRYFDETPFYETHGEGRVRDGKYSEIIRYRDHVVPIAAELRELAESS